MINLTVTALPKNYFQKISFPTTFLRTLEIIQSSFGFEDLKSLPVSTKDSKNHHNHNPHSNDLNYVMYTFQ
jgi:hypothetical protein